LSSNFYHYNLDCESQNGNKNEDPVLENTSEDVELSILEKSSVELIEKLHENKDLENIGEVKELGGSGHLLNIRWQLNDLNPVSRFLQFCASLLVFKVLLLINKATELVQKLSGKVTFLERINFSFDGGDCRPCFNNLLIHIEGLGVEWVIDRSFNTGCLIEVALNILIDWWFGRSFHNIEAFISVVMGKSSLANEDNDDQNNDLINSMSEDISPHNFVHDGVIFVHWLSFKNVFSWWFSGKSKGGKGVHDKVNPKHLDGVQWRVLDND
jgi:hypothetical protein